MKNAHPVPKEEAGAPGMGVAIVTRPAKSDNSASEHADLVTVEHGRPVTTTERVAEELKQSHPDAWAPGLHCRLKTLSTKTVTRAADPGEVLPVCLAHNLRRNNEEHRHRSPIDPARTGANAVLRGPACPLVAAELARSVLDELGAIPRRCDTIMGVEVVVQAPDGHDTSEFWGECLTWADGRYQHVVSAVVHRDQKRPHLHVIALAVADGKLAGHALTSGACRFTAQCADFMRHIRATLGLRPDRKPRDPLKALALTTGKGARTAAGAARRDAELNRKTGCEWTPGAMGMAVDGHGGSVTECVETGNRHAHEKGQPPLLRRFSTSEAIPQNWQQPPVFEATPATPMAPCPKPLQAGQTAVQSDPQDTAARLENSAAGTVTRPCPAPPQTARSRGDRLAHLAVLFSRCKAVATLKGTTA